MASLYMPLILRNLNFLLSMRVKIHTHVNLTSYSNMADEDDWLSLVNEQEEKAKQKQQNKANETSTGLESKVCMHNFYTHILR